MVKWRLTLLLVGKLSDELSPCRTQSVKTAKPHGNLGLSGVKIILIIISDSQSPAFGFSVSYKTRSDTPISSIINQWQWLSISHLRSLINTILDSPSYNDYTILAVTRNTTSASTAALANKSPHTKLVRGNLHDCPAIFAEALKATENPPIWAMFSFQQAVQDAATQE